MRNAMVTTPQTELLVVSYIKAHVTEFKFPIVEEFSPFSL